MKILEDIKVFMVTNNRSGAYETDILIHLVFTYIWLPLRYGPESIYNSVVEIASRLLRNIPDKVIKSCPYVAEEDKLKLIMLKNNNAESFLRNV